MKGYTHFSSKAGKLSERGRRSGDIICCVKDNFVNCFNLFLVVLSTRKVCNVSRLLFSTKRDFVILCPYITPEQSPNYNLTNETAGIMFLDQCLPNLIVYSCGLFVDLRWHEFIHKEASAMFVILIFLTEMWSDELGDSKNDGVNFDRSLIVIFMLRSRIVYRQWQYSRWNVRKPHLHVKYSIQCCWLWFGFDRITLILWYKEYILTTAGLDQCSFKQMNSKNRSERNLSVTD